VRRGEPWKRTRSFEKLSENCRAKILAETVIDARATQEFFGANVED
jgi:hypothetical protein